MPSIYSSVSIGPTRLQRAVAVAQDAMCSGPYPSAAIAVANAETTLLTHAVSHPEQAPAYEVGFQRCLDRIGLVRAPSTIYNLQSAICNLQS